LWEMFKKENYSFLGGKDMEILAGMNVLMEVFYKNNQYSMLNFQRSSAAVSYLEQSAQLEY